ncbi:hypothetical protein F-VV57_0256 [Faustovirus]|nr:hypothetical protein F-VV57_0256 [Faustovirus]QJX73524.1 hypothetical protein F-VV63_0258 [Faustovirus]
MEGIYVVECRAGNYLIEKSTSTHNYNIHPLRRTAPDRGLGIDYIVIYDAPIAPPSDTPLAAMPEVSHVDVTITTATGATHLHFHDLAVKLNGPVVNRNYVIRYAQHRINLTTTGAVASVLVEYKLLGESTYTRSNNYRFVLSEGDISCHAPASCAIM